MLGGVGHKVRSQVIDEPAPLLGELGGRGDHVGGLEQPRDFQGDHAVPAGQGVAVAHTGGNGFVHGPVGINEIQGVGQPFVDDFGGGGSGISVHGVDTGPDTADCKGNIALEDVLGAGVVEAHLFEGVHMGTPLIVLKK